jgi:hypothetical protein
VLLIIAITASSEYPLKEGQFVKTSMLCIKKRLCVDVPIIPVAILGIFASSVSHSEDFDDCQDEIQCSPYQGNVALLQHLKMKK